MADNSEGAESILQTGSFEGPPPNASTAGAPAEPAPAPAVADAIATTLDAAANVPAPLAVDVEGGETNEETESNEESSNGNTSSEGSNASVSADSVVNENAIAPFTVGEATEVVLGGLPQNYGDQISQRISAQLIHRYFTTHDNPLVSHHLESFDQFLQRDLPAILRANPIRLLKNSKAARETNEKAGIFQYQVDVYVGGKSYDKLKIGIPSVIQGRGEDAKKRLLFPNEARLRNLTYAAPILADIEVEVSYRDPPGGELKKLNIPPIKDFRLMNIPIMLHSKYCVLHNKPQALLEQMGECPQDPGGYFIIDGSEKLLVTSQEQSFNTLWVKEQPDDDICQYYANIACLNAVTRDVRTVSFYWTREKIVRNMNPRIEQKDTYKPSVLEVGIPDVLKPIPIFVLFRALGVETDKDILQSIFPDLKSHEAIELSELLTPSLNAASPFLDQYSAFQYIMFLTKTQNENTVLDSLYNKLFCHVKYAVLRRNADGKFVNDKGEELSTEEINKFVANEQSSRIAFLGECVRKILRVIKGYEQPASRDDTRNQRCLTSGFLVQQLFQHAYKEYVRNVKLSIDKTYSYNEESYSGAAFANIFDAGSRNTIFASLFLTEQITKGFKGKWQIGVSKQSEGVLQELSRLSYLDFMSHLRRVVLDFNTEMKLAGPRRLHTSQYGYFCACETPSGANIGIVKNLAIMTSISTSMLPEKLIQWLYEKIGVRHVNLLSPELRQIMVPVYVNHSIIGMFGSTTPETTFQAVMNLFNVLRCMKRSGYLPPLTSITFDPFEKKLSIFTDEGRVCRPLVICPEPGQVPNKKKFGTEKEGRLEFNTWRDLVVGTIPELKDKGVGIYSRVFIDPFEGDDTIRGLEKYLEYFVAQKDKLATIEYLDPYEQNLALIANFPSQVQKETTHLEVHPSTILGLLGNSFPFPMHNQSPRNHLAASQSKQAVSLYATNWQNRFDNTANLLCYGETPLVRTLYQDYFGDGKMPFGQNVILAIGTYGGYNQEDGVIMNKDALQRGQFRSINYRSYETREEEENVMTRTSYSIAHPAKVQNWLDLKPGLDYGKLDPETGIIKEGEYVTSDTVLVARYSFTRGGQPKDASLTPQVFTTGIVEKVVVLYNNVGKRLVKIRIVQDRVPELGDKFSNRHGQKGTLNISYKGHDMPRTADGIIPDMIMNPSAIPSRMTVGQLMEQIMGLSAANLGAISNGTAFMSNGSPHPLVAEILEANGLQKVGNQVLYNGTTGEQMEADIFMGIVYGMRLKHMTIDKMNSRGQGRKEMKTRQPTGGRGNEGGLKIGEMDRDAILGHSIASFLQESMMLRSDGSNFVVCNGCGTIPIYNVKKRFYLCPLCDGPIQYSGDSADTLEPIPPPSASQATFSRIEIPYATKLFVQELETFLNMGTRFLTTGQVAKLHGMQTIKEQEPQLNKLETNIDLRLVTAIRPAQSEVTKTIASLAPVATAAEVAAAAGEEDEAVETITGAPPVGTTVRFAPPTNSAAPAPAASAAPSVGTAAPATAIFNPATGQSGGAQPSMTTTLQQGQASPVAAVQHTLAATITSVPATVPTVNGPAPELVAANQVVQQKAIEQGLPPPPALTGGGPPAEIVPGSTIPVISVDTSEQALALDGLNEEAPTSLPTPNEAYKSASRAPSTRRLPRRQPSPQSYAPQQSDAQESAAPQSHAPVRVIKEG